MITFLTLEKDGLLYQLTCPEIKTDDLSVESVELPAKVRITVLNQQKKHGV